MVEWRGKILYLRNIFKSKLWVLVLVSLHQCCILLSYHRVELSNVWNIFTKELCLISNNKLKQLQSWKEVIMMWLCVLE